jgi:hypothetical protein
VREKEEADSEIRLLIELVPSFVISGMKSL